MDLIKNQEQQKQTNVFQLEEVKQAEKQRFSLPDEAHKTLDAAEDQKLVQNARKTIGKNMPPQYSEEAKKKKVTKATGEIPLAEQKKAEREKAQAEEVTEGMDSFPVTLQNAVLALATWGKVKAESSGPVKEAAERLAAAATHEEAAKCLGELLSACVSYLDLRADQWHLWLGNGRRRLKQVRKLIEEAYAYSAEAPAAYDEALRDTMDVFVKQSANAPERFQRHVKKAEFLRDLKKLGKEEGELGRHIRGEEALTADSFKTLKNRFKDFRKMGYTMLHFKSVEDAAAHKEQNAKLLLEMRNQARDLERGLACDFAISYEDYVNAKINAMTVEHLIAHIDEANDPQMVFEMMKAGFEAQQTMDMEQLQYAYGIATGDSVLSIKDNNAALQLYKDNGAFAEAAEDPKYKKYTEDNMDSMTAVSLITTMLNENGDERAWKMGAPFPEAEKKERYMSLVRRRARGQMVSQAAGLGQRASSSMEKRLTEASLQADPAMMKKLVAEVLKLNVADLDRNFFAQPGISLSKVAELVTMKDHLPELTANAVRYGITPDELSNLSAICEGAAYLQEKYAVEMKLYAAGDVYMDPALLKNTKTNEAVRRFIQCIEKSPDPMRQKKKNTLKDERKLLSGRRQEVAISEFLAEKVREKEDALMDSLMREKERQTRFSDGDAFYSEQAFQEKNSARIQQLDTALAYFHAYEKNERKRGKKSERYQKMKGRMEELENTKKHLSSLSFEDGMKELFSAEDCFAEDTLKKINMELYRNNGNANAIVLNGKEYAKKKEAALLMLQGLVEKCDAQLKALPENLQGKLKEQITSIREKRSAQLEKLTGMSFDDYLSLSNRFFFKNMQEVLSQDEDRDKLLLKEGSAYDNMLTRIKNERENGRSLMRPEDEDYNTMPYNTERQKTACTAKAREKFTENILTALDNLDEKEIAKAKDPLKLILPDNTVIRNVFHGIYSDMQFEDIVHVRKCFGMVQLAADPDIHLGGDDILSTSRFMERFFEEPGFAEKLGLTPDMKEEFEALHDEMDKVVLLSAKRYFINTLSGKSMHLPTEGLSEAKKKIAQAFDRVYNNTWDDLEYSTTMQISSAFRRFSRSFYRFLMEHGMKDEIRKENGTTSYIARVEALESLLDTRGMTEEQIYRARAQLLENALKGQVPDTEGASEDVKKKVTSIKEMEKYSIGAFTVQMRMEYYRSKCKSEEGQAKNLKEADPKELNAPDSFDKTVTAYIENGRTKAKALLAQNNGSVNTSRMTQALSEAKKSSQGYQKYVKQYQDELNELMKKPEQERDPKELQSARSGVERNKKDLEKKQKEINDILDAMNGGEVVSLTAKDSYYLQEYMPPTEEPIFKEGESLMTGLMQVGNTCYFTCELLGLVNGGHEDFIKNTLVKEHPSDKTKAIVRLHDCEGRPIDVVVEKSRQKYNDDTKYDHRAMWVILVEKAAALVMNKTDFKDQSQNPFNDGAILKKGADWKALAAMEKEGKDFCEKQGLSTMNIQSGAETVGARMLFGKDIVVLDTHAGGERDEMGNALTQYNPISDEIIGQMAEFLEQGKIVVGGTCGCDGITREGDKIIYNYESHGIIYDNGAPVEDGHAICFKSVDMAGHTITLLDSKKDPTGEHGNETTITFGEFRRYFANVYVIDAPGI